MADSERYQDRSHYAADDNWDKAHINPPGDYGAARRQPADLGTDYNPGGFARVGNTGSFGLPAAGTRRPSDFDNEYSYGNFNLADERRLEGQRRAAEGPYRGRGPRGYQRSAERIREDVCERLTEDPFVDASGMDIRVEGGEVILTGTVSTRREKRRAEDLAEAISGVRNVENHLRIAH